MVLKFFKQAGPHILALGVMLALACIYFFPQLQGKRLPQSDIINYRCMAQETIQHRKETGKETYWTNSMFGGMPTYQLSMGQRYNGVQYLSKITKLFLSGPISLFFAYMVGGYLMLILLKVDLRVALIGAFAFAFSTYNILLLEAGHNTKISTVGYLGILLGGMFLVFEQKKLLWGGLVIALGMGLSTYANHIQMTYYFLLVLGIYFLILFVPSAKEKEWSLFLNRFIIVSFAATIGFLTSAERMLPTYEYQQDTMRGKPVLLSKGSGAGSSSGVDGLNWDYAMKWSHKPIDLLAMIMPSAAGGGNKTIKPRTDFRKVLDQKGYRDDKIYLYWGGLDFTSGPPYFSIVLWFFMLYFLIVTKQPLRWWVLTSIILLALMSLGKYFGSFNKALFDFLPLLNKFRAPGSISAVIAIPLTVGGTLGINHFLFKERDPKMKCQSLKYTGIAMGVFLLLALVGGSLFNSFQGFDDSHFEKTGMLDVVIGARRKLFLFSGLRSLAVFGLCFLTSWAIYKNWIKLSHRLLALAIITICDLWSVDRQYLPSSKFVEADLVDEAIEPRPVDDLIAQDDELYFRVHDKTVDPFKSSWASYFHKTVGGFSPVKLLRYQDMIDQYLVFDHQEVLNMLNTRYIISDHNGATAATINEDALGNAWFVNEFTLVQDAEEEINQISENDPLEKAIIHEELSAYLQGLNMEKQGTITLTDYAPDQLVYISDAASEQFAVFSDIWYGPDKGWNAYVDGKRVEHIRANFILRAMRVPAGKHTIQFKFEPKTVKIGAVISFITSMGLLIGLILLGAKHLKLKFLNSS